MRVSEVMTRGVRVIEETTTLAEAARLMREHDVGSLPVNSGDTLVGMVTDRDLVIRGLAEGLSGDEAVTRVMSDGVKYCYEDEDVESVAANMAQLQIRRIAVLSRDKRLVGIVSLANIASANDLSATDDLLDATAQPH
ncbi:CBS domain-containing protein [Arenimonas sp. MALMAid1274]|uniref:CBS domain-containing protein n=1 Tax=Arenimonas sp. MALMAid1274 TaxID=3411630 RepID=UPI003BA0AD90